ncbi:MAG: hypothetical protein O7149_00600, partial [Wolbachia endosymbiont of Hylaeus sinuatus]|nr:hypothetical protein [Wolbachia endosymbiont of Hylaeus sinuatus]
SKISHSLSLISLGYNLPSYFLLTSSYSFLYSLSRQVLSNLIRGQEGTKEYQHTAGEKFVLLDDSIISFEVQRGKKFYLKAVTYGDSLENTEVKVINSFSN